MLIYLKKTAIQILTFELYCMYSTYKNSAVLYVHLCVNGKAAKSLQTFIGIGKPPAHMLINKVSAYFTN